MSDSRVGVLAPRPVVAEFPAVVAPEHDDRIVAEAEAVEFAQDASNLSIGVGDTSVVAVDQKAQGSGIDGAGLRDAGVVAEFAPFRASAAGHVFGPCGAGGKLDGSGIVKIPVTLGRVEWQMGLRNPAARKNGWPRSRPSSAMA